MDREHLTSRMTKALREITSAIDHLDAQPRGIKDTQDWRIAYRALHDARHHVDWLTRYKEAV